MPSKTSAVRRRAGDQVNPRWLTPVAVIAAIAVYAIFDRRCRHNEAVARAIAYGAGRRAAEQRARIACA